MTNPRWSRRWIAVVALLVATTALTSAIVWSLTAGSIDSHTAADDHDAIEATLARIAADATQIAVVEEIPRVDALVRAAAATKGRAVKIVSRNIEELDAAARAGILLAGQRGRAYLELVGYRLRWLRQDAGAPGFPWARVDQQLHCVRIREDSWSPLPGVEYTGRLGVEMPPGVDGALTFIIGDAFPLDIVAEALDHTPVRLRREMLRAGPDTRTPADFWLGDGNPWSAPGSVLRVTLDALPARPRLVGMRLGRRAPRVLARARGFASDVRPRVCAAPLGVDAGFATDADQTQIVLPQMPEYFATGWSGAEVASSNGQSRGVVRWMGERGVILVPSERRGLVRVVLRASVPERTAEQPPQLKLTVNDTVHLSSIPVTRERGRYEWTIPAHAWVAGVNELLFALSPASSNGRALAFERLELALLHREQFDVEHQR